MIDSLHIHKQNQRFLFIDLNVINHLIHKICNLFSKRIGYLSAHLLSY
jgi:hypothetical protein